jgi:hypothetical protein
MLNMSAKCNAAGCGAVSYDFPSGYYDFTQKASLYYTFESGSTDSSVNGYDGELKGSAAISTAQFRYGEQALFLSSSSSDYVYYSGTHGSTSGTVTMYVRQSTGGYPAELFKIGTSGSTNFIEAAFTSDDGEPKLHTPSHTTGFNT